MFDDADWAEVVTRWRSEGSSHDIYVSLNASRRSLYGSTTSPVLPGLLRRMSQSPFPHFPSLWRMCLGTLNRHPRAASGMSFCYLANLSHRTRRRDARANRSSTCITAPAIHSAAAQLDGPRVRRTSSAPRASRRTDRWQVAGHSKITRPIGALGWRLNVLGLSATVIVGLVSPSRQSPFPVGWISRASCRGLGHLSWLTRQTGQRSLRGGVRKLPRMTCMCHSTHHVAVSAGRQRRPCCLDFCAECSSPHFPLDEPSDDTAGGSHHSTPATRV